MKKNKTGFGIISSIKFLGGYLKRYRLSFILFAAGWFLEGVLQLMLPILFGILIDEMVYYRNIGTFLQISLVIFIFTLFLCSLYFVILHLFQPHRRPICLRHQDGFVRSLAETEKRIYG